MKIATNSKPKYRPTDVSARRNFMARGFTT